jgi:60S ribosome subunit biogenesis protein NIP7
MSHASSQHLQIWVKPSAEMQYLYGNHVLKSGLGRITEGTPPHTGVVIYSMSDVPLGFGVTARSTEECRALDPGAIVAFHQSDIGACTCCVLVMAAGTGMLYLA